MELRTGNKITQYKNIHISPGTICTTVTKDTQTDGKRERVRDKKLMHGTKQ